MEKQPEEILEYRSPDARFCYGFHPERLVSDRGKQFLPEYGKEYILSGLFH